MDAILGHRTRIASTDAAQTLNLIVSQSALADLTRLQAFLADKNQSATQRSVSAIGLAINSLMVFPDRGRPTASTGVRELVVPFGRTAYLVRYIHDRERDEIVILRIWHGRESHV